MFPRAMLAVAWSFLLIPISVSLLSRLPAAEAQVRSAALDKVIEGAKTEQVLKLQMVGRSSRWRGRFKADACRHE